MYHFFPMFWDFNGNRFDSNIFLCLHLCSWQRCLSLKHCHIYTEYPDCILALLQTHIVLSIRALYSLIMLLSNSSYDLFYGVYLSPSGNTDFSRFDCCTKRLNYHIIYFSLHLKHPSMLPATPLKH